jgi:hypothetical protein
VVDAVDRRHPWPHASRDDDPVVVTVAQRVEIDRGADAQLDAEQIEPAPEVAHQLVELLLARHRAGPVELAADVVLCFEQGDLVAAFRRRDRTCHPGRASADDGDAPLRGRCRQRRELELAAGLRVDEAGRRPVGEDVVEAGLVAGDAGVDLVGTPFGRLLHEGRIGENGRAIETIAASPLARISSASSGVLIRFDATTGIATARCTRAGAKRNAARGTTYAIVGMRASCQPMPVLRMSAPAASTDAPGSRSRPAARRPRPGRSPTAGT